MLGVSSSSCSHGRGRGGLLSPRAAAAGKVSGVKGVEANCGDIQYAGSGDAHKLIVSDLPLQGDSAERSKQMNDAIVQEMARKGWQAGDTQVAFQACDDSLASTGEWDENLCRSNAQKYAATPT